MDTLLYLSEILQQRTSVGVTGLGTFFKKKFAGRYDKEKQSFLPPGYRLQFTSEVKDEELLQNFIAEKENVSKEIAGYHISEFVEETTRKLEIEHEAELENIGRLFFTEHEGLSFEPSKNINYGSEFYGLPVVAETEPAAEVEKKEDILEKDANIQETEEDVYDEITEGPYAAVPFENKSYKAPVIENVELDEVKDDLKNTLKHSENLTGEIVEAPDFIKEQHEEHPNRFGHTPESEVEDIATDQPTIVNPASADVQNEAGAVENIAETEEETPVKTEETEVPDSILAQHEEHPDRFGHTPESEAENLVAAQQVGENTPEPETTDTVNEVEVPPSVVAPHTEYTSRFSLRSETEAPKTYINLEDEAKSETTIIEAPEFIKEQHAEHPNRFGHDPMIYEEEVPQGMSAWLKVTIIILILIIITAITYLIKPELFTGQTESIKNTKSVIDSPKVTVDAVKARQDSIIKTDSILKANQVQQKTDTPKTKISALPKTTAPDTKSGNTTYEVIGASFRTTKAAEKFIQQMKGYGVTARIVPIEGPFKKVSLASFKTEKEALNARPLLSKKVRIKELDIKQINTP
ncbi:hypothetical protein [Pedobacter rhodius]|uniref:SPOR domain-containing protein n=1 Tax=Pedobacter rhodius TaxID=3004098 RepID=A0ABT4L364_9SPHI|nr:hypothetical protein [Pedobacter sp. SJ11]MCZ4225615.1 hypothetical protein [Pedobacter sp. SJ11]